VRLSECDRECSIMRRPWFLRRCSAPCKRKIIKQTKVLHCVSQENYLLFSSVYANQYNLKNTGPFDPVLNEIFYCPKFF